MRQPLVLEFKANSLDDGPGIRTAVFFKGCPLSCIWCHNPESKKPEAELSVALDDCIGCFTCRNVCPKGAASPDKPGIVDRSICDLCFECVEHCPPKGLTRVGKEMSVEEIVKKCASDKPFYDVSGGGVTLSGGEPCLCPEWMGGLCKALHDEGISIHIETAGLFDYDKVKEYMLPFVSSVYMDIKIIDREQHKKYCGVYNEVILENFKRFLEDSKEMGFDYLTRTPLIPNITDTDENLQDIVKLYKENGVTRTELLAYNPTWYIKAKKLGVPVAEEVAGLDSWQSPEKIEHCKSFFLAEGIECL